MTAIGANLPAEPVVIDAEIASDLAGTALVLARRFGAGATMWCLAPGSPEHARHVAVEFVHPVIMGKRALPAVGVDEPDPVSALRAVVRPGDILLVVESSSSRAARDVLRRAGAWGLTSVWIGAGARPTPGFADHVLWIDDPTGTAAHDGRLVVLYHVLWELTHVCFEHPGLLTAATADCDDVVCTTCSDEGRLAEVVAPLDPCTATVRTARGTETVDTTVVGRREAGDLLLVHAGSAIAVLDAEG
jgi:hypothetical protein